MDRKFCGTVVGLCALWYIVGSTCNVLNKMFLMDYSYPVTVSMASLLSISFYSVPLTRQLAVPVRTIPISYRCRMMVPISIGKAIAICASQMSLLKVPVSYAHTVKATMPLFAVFTARLVLGEKQHAKVYVSLLPIVIGVIIATVTEVSFDMLGLCSALLSTFTYSVLNTLAKKVYHDMNMNPMVLLRDTAQVAVLILLPFWVVTDGWRLYEYDTGMLTAVVVSWLTFVWPSTSPPPLTGHFFLLLFASGLLSFLQNLFAFILIRKLTALSYAVANTTKRIVVISASLLTLQNPVTPMNVFGMLMAVFGVFTYNRTKESVRRAEAAKSGALPGGDLLPRVMTSATLSDASLLTLPERSLHVPKNEDKTKLSTSRTLLDTNVNRLQQRRFPLFDENDSSPQTVRPEQDWQIIGERKGMYNV